MKKQLHSSYGWDLVPSDFHLFDPLKIFLRGTNFSNDDEVKSTVNKWLRTQFKNLYAEMIIINLLFDGEKNMF